MIFNRLVRSKAPPGGWDGDPRDELVARLEAIAADDPTLTGRVRRSRSLVLQQFARQAAQPRPRGWIIGRRLAPALAIGLVLVAVTFGGVAASGPGQPMYPVRLFAEELMLPAELSARLPAQMDRLDRRVDEAVAALAATNQDAARAALAAYRRIASDVMSANRPGEALAMTLRSRMTAQIGRLRLLLAADSRAREEALTAADGIVAWLRNGRPDDRPPAPANSPLAGPSVEPTPRATPRATSRATPRPSGPSDGPNTTPHPQGSNGSQQSSDPTPSSGPRTSAAPGGGGG